jgi:type I restriction enzyme S subunit
MQSEWRDVQLGNVAQIRRGSSPRPIIDFMANDGMPWVKIADATQSNSRFIDSTKEFIKQEGVPRSVIVEKDDLILSNSGTAGLPKFMGLTACVHDGWQVFKELDGIDKEFLYYTLINIRSRLLFNAYDSTMKNLTLDMVREAKINLPPLPIQKKIAHILSTLDEKIELNQKINQTLEEIAQALFKSWFVDFDPVHAKAECKSEQELETAATKLGISKEILDLFPSEFEESEMGMIPKGWNIVKFEDIASVRKGLSYKGKHKSENEDDTPMFNLGNFGRSGQYRPEKIAHYNGDYKDRHLIRGGQLMIANTDMTQDRIILGLPLLVPKLVDADMIFTHHVFAIDFNSSDLESTLKYYIFYTFLNPKFREIAEGYATGTTVLALPKDGVMQFNLLLATDKVIESFNEIVHELVEKMISNKSEIETLQKTRDTLLPKLLSGELDVSEIGISNE